MIIFILLFNLTFAQNNDSFNEFLKLNCADSYFNYSKFIDEVKNSDFFQSCATKEAIIRNNFIPIHKNIFNFFYNDALSKEANNLCQVFNKTALPSSLHYAFLVNKAYNAKLISDFKYFKILNHYGTFFDSKLDDTKLFFSILSHQDQNGLTCSSDDFITIYNSYKKNDESLASSDDFMLLREENIYEILKNQIIDNKDNKEYLKKESIKNTYEQLAEIPKIKPFAIDLDYLEDNPDISLYVNGFEIIDVELRSLINTYLKKDKDNILRCMNDFEEKYIIDFIINENEIYSNNLCLKDFLNKHLLGLIKDRYEVRVVSLIKV